MRVWDSSVQKKSDELGFGELGRAMRKVLAVSSPKILAGHGVEIVTSSQWRLRRSARLLLYSY